MSMELMVQAMKIRVGSPMRKLVLLKLADNANDRGECWPSYQHIADQCEISRRSAMNHVEALIESGLVTKVVRKGPKGNSTNVYILTLGGGEKSAPRSAGDSPDGEAGSPDDAGDSLGGGAGDSPGTSHSFEPVKEPVIEPVARKKKYSDDFEAAWTAYPKRPGSNPKSAAYSAWKARLAEGETVDAMLDGLNRYAAYCVARGIVGSEFVMQAKRFFGPAREYENDWAIPTTGPPRAGYQTAQERRAARNAEIFDYEKATTF